MNRVLFLRIEPTGYMLALARALEQIWPEGVDTVFVSPALSQAWDLNKNGLRLLPEGREASAVREMIRSDPPAIIHCAGWGARPCRTAITMAHRHGIPVVVDLDTWTDAARGPKAFLKRLVLPKLLKRVTHFAPGGQRQAAFLRNYGVPEGRITPINMTVDVTGIRHYQAEHPEARSAFRERHGLPQKAPLVLFLGRLAPEKGLSDLLDAWPDVAQSVPEAHLVIVGDGILMPQVRARASDRVHVLGRLSGDEVWQAYAAADAFAAPSRWEPWGLTINEAMAAGLPIVMTEAFGCIGDLAVPNETASIVPVAAPGLLADALKRVLTDASWRTGLRAAASERISGWTIEAEAQRIADIWRSCLGNGPGIRNPPHPGA